MDLRPRVYFAHPVNSFNASIERILLRRIREYFPNYEIENPNKPVHQEGYQRWKKETGNGMDYYYKVVLPNCEICVALPFRDGAWGAGVFGEATFFEKSGKIVWKITHEGCFSIIYITLEKSLSIEETRNRTKQPY